MLKPTTRLVQGVINLRRYFFARILRLPIWIFSVLVAIHRLIIMAYSHIIPPCFYSPDAAFITDEFTIDDVGCCLKILHKRALYKCRRGAFKIILICITIGMFVAKLTNSLAGSHTGSMTVTANVTPKCLVTSGSLFFGSYSPTGVNSNTDLNVTGSFVLTCTKNTAATISLDNGLNASHASGTTRAMSGVSKPNNYLNYEIYTTAAETTVWNNTNKVNVTSTNIQPRTINVYGRIPKSQNPGADSYIDTVTITVNF